MTLAIIPARGGSKGVKRKNIRPIAGHPLIAWTISAAINSSRIDKIIVSTEDAEIAAISERYGASVLKRPEELARDDSTTRDVLAHVLSEIPNCDDPIVLLQATSPIRRSGLIDAVIVAFGHADWDSMATGSMQLQYPPHGTEHRRQDVKSVFINDGSVIAFKRENLRRKSLFGPKAGTMTTSREENIDIDDEFDFWLAEKVIEKGLSEKWLFEPVKAS
ncbi:MAG: acylneuraminate cytidylyltransferase family protein [Deltaproteobacteria bacterium]|jgi:N-acylneuraminate cytidylyltransferase|nr:acylneuraminate cytidylyltransferase family protein [Deltaproteobacteria bacterium]